MSQLILISGLSVMLFGTCSPSSDQEGRLARHREALTEWETDQIDAATAEQAARQQAREAHLAHRADLVDEMRQCVLRLEELTSDMEARLKAYEDQVDSSEEQARYAQMTQALDEARSNLRRTRAAWKGMATELALAKQG